MIGYYAEEECRAQLVNISMDASAMTDEDRESKCTFNGWMTGSYVYYSFGNFNRDE